MATISFTLRNKKAEKTDVLVQFSGGRGKQTKKGIKGLKIAPKWWDSIKKRVTSDHDGYEDINSHLNEWEANNRIVTGKLH